MPRFPARIPRAAAAFVLAPAAPLVLAAGPRCELQSFDLPVTMVGLRPIAELVLNDTAVPFIVDSGAFYSVLDPYAAADLQLKTRPTRMRAWGITGPVSLRVTEVERVALQGAEVKNVEFLVGGVEFEASARGLLGLNVLGKNDTEYDIANGVVRLVRPGEGCRNATLAYWAGSAPVVEVPLEQRSFDRLPAIQAEARVNGKPVKVILDTGAFSILSLDAAERIGLVDDVEKLEPAGHAYGIGGGWTKAYSVPIDTFEIGGERVTNGKLRVARMPGLDADMLLGIDFFLSHRIYVARSQSRLYFTYSGGPIFDLSMRAETEAVQVAATEAPQDADGFARRGSALVARNELAQAVEALDRAIALAPDVAAYRAQRARARVQQERREDAVTDFNEALRLDPADVDVRFELVDLLKADAGGAAEALAHLQRLDTLLPPTSSLRWRLAHLLLRLEEPAAALQQLDRWMQAFPRAAGFGSVLNLRGWMRALANTELDGALDDCNRAVRASPQSGNYLDSRATVHLRRKDYVRAIADYDAALKLDPKIAWSHWGRGLAKIATGAREAGLADIAAAKELDPKIVRRAERYGLGMPAELPAGGEAQSPGGRVTPADPAPA